MRLPFFLALIERFSIKSRNFPWILFLLSVAIKQKTESSLVKAFDILKNDEYIIVDEYNNVNSLNEIINIITKKQRVYKEEDAGKIIDNQYIVSEVGLLQHSYKGFIVVENETYDYLICDYGLFDYWGNIDEF